MIFNSTSIEKLRSKYANEPDFRVPYIVRLDRSTEFEIERACLEELILLVPQDKQKDWESSLVNENDSQHMGAWFEMMMFDWLRKTVAVTVAPTLEGNQPDFTVDIQDYHIALEARVFVIDEEEKIEQTHRAEMIWTLSSIKKPFLVVINSLHRTDSSLNIPELKTQVERWLDRNPEESFEYTDKNGNQILLSAKRNWSLKQVGIAGPTRGFGVSPASLQRPLSKKAKQHKAIRSAGHPYIIAILLESYKLSAEEVVEAWFGKERLTFDFEQNDVIGTDLDGSGLHFVGLDIVHTTVSGTLVFRIEKPRGAGRRYLRGWYIQNPYAKQPLPTDLFPVESSFIVKKSTGSDYEMGWQLSEMKTFDD